MARKKIVFVIVEGPSDEEALGVVLARIYDRASVHVHVMYCDITTNDGVHPGNVLAKIGNVVRAYSEKRFQPKDFSQIIHITDMDGAYVPNSSIIEDADRERPYYLLREIRTCNKVGIERRNSRKRENLNLLASTKKVWYVPYQIYYMSCNLDHALYGKLNSTKEEKEGDAYSFAQRYKDDIPGFLRFISCSDFSVMGDYSASWQFIKEGLHSLERHTNLGLCFQGESSEPVDNRSYS